MQQVTVCEMTSINWLNGLQCVTMSHSGKALQLTRTESCRVCKAEEPLKEAEQEAG